MYVLSVVEGHYGTENYCFLSLVCCGSENPFICISDHKQFCLLIHKLLPFVRHLIYRHSTPRSLPTNRHHLSQSSKRKHRERPVSRRYKPKPTPSKLIKRFVGRIVWGIVTQTAERSGRQNNGSRAAQPLSTTRAFRGH